MAVPYIGHLEARLRARFHVQVQVSYSGAEPRTRAAVPVQGHVVRVFRSGGALHVGDEVRFSVNVRPSGERIMPGLTFMPYDTFIRANYMEVYLDGSPPECEVPLDECVVIDAPTRSPQLRASWFVYWIVRARIRLIW
jgi:hypothetical protein